MTHRASGFRKIEDALLLAVPIALLVWRSPPLWLWLLAVAGLSVLAWSILTLNFPREIDLDDRGIRLRAYGREHAYAWSECRVRVRRFLVKDRVLVRIEDREKNLTRSYWLVAYLSDFPTLVKEVEARVA